MFQVVLGILLFLGDSKVKVLICASSVFLKLIIRPEQRRGDPCTPAKHSSCSRS